MTRADDERLSRPLRIGLSRTGCGTASLPPSIHAFIPAISIAQLELHEDALWPSDRIPLLGEASDPLGADDHVVVHHPLDFVILVMEQAQPGRALAVQGLHEPRRARAVFGLSVDGYPRPWADPRGARHGHEGPRPPVAAGGHRQALREALATAGCLRRPSFTGRPRVDGLRDGAGPGVRRDRSVGRSAAFACPYDGRFPRRQSASEGHRGIPGNHRRVVPARPGRYGNDAGHECWSGSRGSGSAG